MVVDCHGHPVELRWNRTGIEQLVRGLLLPCWRETRRPPAVLISIWQTRAGYRIELRGEVFNPGTEQALMNRLERELHLEVALHARGYVFVHAGVVAVGPGVVVMPGESRSGKSTLTRALVERGGMFYSDEYALLDGQGRVHAYPRDMSQRNPPHGKLLTPAQELGWHAGLGPRPIRMVLVSTYLPGARFEPRRLTPGLAALRLVAHTLSDWEDPGRVLTQFCRALSGVACLEAERGEAAEAAEALWELLD